MGKGVYKKWYDDLKKKKSPLYQINQRRRQNLAGEVRYEEVQILGTQKRNHINKKCFLF